MQIMNLNIIASGSSGNCTCIESSGKYIFIDVGVTAVNVKNSMPELNRDMDISLFITHEHTDHIKGLATFAKRYNPKIYTSAKTADIIAKKDIDIDNIYILEHNICYDLKWFEVKPFKLTHDAEEPLGYSFDVEGKRIAIATDFGVATDYIYNSLSDVSTLILESNYEDELLKASDYPAYLKKRIASTRGHLSNSEALSLVGSLSSSKLNKCFLAHVSENCNDYDLLQRYATYCVESYKVDTEILRQRVSIQRVI